jgi:hypothetical protein
MDRPGGLGPSFSSARAVLSTNNTPPEFTDTALGGTTVVSSNLGSSDTTGSYTAGPPSYTSTFLTLNYAEGVAEGTWAKIGIQINSTDFFSISLIKDEIGDTTTITIASDEALEIEYELRIYHPTDDDIEYDLDIGGNLHDVFVRAGRITSVRNTAFTSTGGWFPWQMARGGLVPTWFFNISDTNSTRGYTGSIAAATAASPTGTVIALSGATTSYGSYSTGQHYVDVTLNVPVGGGNHASGIGALRLVTPAVIFQVGFEPNVMKEDVYIFTYTIRFAWSRYP